MFPVKQSTSLAAVFFAYDANGDGVTGKVDGDWTKRISKNGGSFAAMTVTVSELENGFYGFTLSSSHTDTLGILTVSLSASGVKRVNLMWRVHARVADDLAYPTTSGRSMDVDASGGVEVGAFQTGAITSGAFSVGAIDAAAIATDAIGSAELAASAASEIATAAAAAILSTPANLLVTDSSGRVTVGSIASGAVTAAAIATDAIDADALAADAGTEIGTAVWATPTRALTDKAGFSLSAAGIQAIWDALTSALTTAGSVGKLIVDNLNATISSRLASASYTAPDNASITAIKAKTDNLPASPAAVGSAMTLSSGAIVSSTFSAGAIDAAAVATGAIDADALATDAAQEIADALLDRTAGVETNRTVRQALRLMLAALAGKLSGAATTTVTIRDSNDSKDRIIATVDSDGNRTAVTYDQT